MVLPPARVSAAKRLILVGGGHAHLEVLREASHRRFDAEIVLVSLLPTQLYSGMMPGQLRGAWTESALSIDLPKLCTAAGARFVEGAATRIDATTGAVSVHVSAESMDGSVASLDIGASVTGLSLPGVREHAFLTRPAQAWRRLVSHVEALSARQTNRRALSCCVVGGGAAGVELALALEARLRGDPCTMHDTPAATSASAVSTATIVTLLTALPTVPAGFDAAVATRITRLLAQRGIVVELNATVTEINATEIRLADGRRIPSSLTVWATGASAPPLLRASMLPTDADGYLAVDDTLRADGGLAVWGAGDCIAMRDAPWMTKSGVYAVRAAPILAHNLRVACASDGGTMKRFSPQRHTMFILDSADGRALLISRWLTTHATWALKVKQFIDRRFVARYQR